MTTDSTPTAGDEPTCTCRPTPGPALVPDPIHAVDCAVTAATQPHAMVDDLGQVFYPDSAIDMAWFAREHGARFMDPVAGAAWLAEVTDDPTPTTGAPEEHYFPEGCGCHIREDPEWGDVYAHPPGGCRVHTPWAFPGYSLTTDAGV